MCLESSFNINNWDIDNVSVVENINKKDKKKYFQKKHPKKQEKQEKINTKV